MKSSVTKVQGPRECRMSLNMPAAREELVAVALVSAAIAAVLALHLTLAALAAMLVYVVGERLAGSLRERMHSSHAGAWSIAILLALVAGRPAAIAAGAPHPAESRAGLPGVPAHRAAGPAEVLTTLAADV